MGKAVYIAEKPSVAQEFAKALKLNAKRKDGYLESEEAIVTWCVGHLVTMSYPEVYDPALKKWSLNTLPFLPQEFQYEVIPGVAKQFQIVSSLLNRQDVDTIYVCTDSGREGEYIYRLVEQEAHVTGKQRKRVWIDSQTEEEILRGIRQAKDLSEYDNLSASAYLRAKEDYLMGINFSRLLTLKYGNSISGYLKTKYAVVSVGRVMTCVLGMVVRREREIREFVKTPFYRVLATLEAEGKTFEGEWKAVKGSRYFESFDLYKENGFKQKEKAQELADKEVTFSEKAQQELKLLDNALEKILTLTTDAFEFDEARTASQVEPLEQVIDILVERLRAQHIKRLKDGVCSIDTGVVYLDVLSNAERISDHCSNIAARLVGMEAGEDYDSHTLKNMMHHNPTKEYMLNYEQCRKDYLIPLEQLEA